MKIIRDCSSQGEDAGNCAIAILAFVESPLKRGVHQCGGMEVGLAEFEMDDGATFALQFFGARINRQCALTRHHCHSMLAVACFSFPESPSQTEARRPAI